MLGKPVPDFSLPSTGGGTFRLSSARGSKLTLYFYGDLHAQFRKSDCLVHGISRDSLKSHDAFKAKMKFPFELLSDADETACELFGVIKLKNMYGKKVRGIERSTFVVDAQGVLAREWRGVKVPGHVQEVLNFVEAL
jgi:thioredoxin-dependent peroxiredoxin